MTVKKANQKELFKAPYQLFLGCDDNELAIKTSRGIAQWNPDVCVAEFAGEKSTLSVGLPKNSIKEAAKIKSGSKEPGRVLTGSITKKQAEDIAKQKMKDLNAFDLDQATKIICGSARSMGIEVKS